VEKVTVGLTEFSRHTTDSLWVEAESAVPSVDVYTSVLKLVAEFVSGSEI
jgi:hypothetical protein